MARQNKVVLDSSVVVKWFTREDGSEEATELMSSFVSGSLSILVSGLVLYEVANALRYKPDFTGKDVEHSIEQLLRLELDVRNLSPDLVKESTKIAFDGDVTFYDALPVALAKLERVQCITADRLSQFARLSNRGYPIQLLE